ncbi:hypothetical protein BpHYR1_021273 [Brachionus plicatilis]|uniref:Uncharacterized protein n=1 Tax=Brachionus plicatilis TaxID=10195 RepID=A0A3M7P224_BRAPC|nr:hypothetical protein BpHYR1_021273 [Brachionus plicatilis]
MRPASGSPLLHLKSCLRLRGIFQLLRPKNKAVLCMDSLLLGLAQYILSKIACSVIFEKNISTKLWNLIKFQKININEQYLKKKKLRDLFKAANRKEEYKALLTIKKQRFAGGI